MFKFCINKQEEKLYLDGPYLFFLLLLSYVCQAVRSFIYSIRCQEVLFVIILGAYQLFCRLDYAGINLLISGSAFPALYYGMYCTPMLATFYLIFIVTIGLSLFIITLFEYLHRPQNFVLKSCAYGGFGVSLVIPLSHAMINEIVYNNYGDNFSMVASLEEYIAVGISYLGGLYIYTVRCPERHKPGNYNICGHSHQIWHVMVVLGIIFTYMGAL